MHRFAVLLSAVLIGSLGAAAPAHARIRPGKGMDGVRLGDGLKRVKRVLGQPAQTFSGPGVKRLEYPRRKLTVTVSRKRGVTSLVTLNHHERTPKGVGPGSTFAAVARAYPGSCSTGAPVCTLATPTTFTQFQSAQLHAKRVEVVQITDRRY